MNDPRQFLTAKKVAARLSISTRTLWRWTRAGVLPAPVRPQPHCPRWRTADVDAWLERLAGRRPPA